MSFLARTSACTAAALLLLLAPALAAAAAAAADDSAAAPELLGDNPGVPPSLVGVWLEERDLTAAPYAPDKDGASSMILTRQWLNTADGGGNGYVRYTKLDANGSLILGAWVKDEFLGWECSPDTPGAIRFYTHTRDFDDQGNQVKERQLCLEAVIEGGDLQFNYTETKDGCPVGTDRFRATRVPTQLIPGVGDAQEC